MIWEIIGWVAVALTAIQFTPQVFKAYKTKKLSDISLQAFVLVCLTASTWILHGIHKQDMVVIWANVLVLVSALSIVVMKLAYK